MIEKEGSKFRFAISPTKLGKISHQVGTPFWAYDATIIRSQIGRLRSFDTIRYAQKANSNINILRLIRQQGVKVDAVPIGEVERALAAGYRTGEDLDEIIYTADLIDADVPMRVLDMRITVNCGSTDMLQQIGQRRMGHPIWLRINPGFGHGHSQKTNTGGPSSKHGIWHESLGEALEHIDSYQLDLIGIHMHIGSGVDYTHLSRVCEAMTNIVRRLGRPIQAVSAGGGLSVPYRAGELQIDAGHYFDQWDLTRKELEKTNGKPLRLEIEPGRFLVAQAGVLVCDVRAVKRVADRGLRHGECRFQRTRSARNLWELPRYQFHYQGRPASQKR